MLKKNYDSIVDIFRTRSGLRPSVKIIIVICMVYFGPPTIYRLFTLYRVSCSSEYDMGRVLSTFQRQAKFANEILKPGYDITVLGVEAVSETRAEAKGILELTCKYKTTVAGDGGLGEVDSCRLRSYATGINIFSFLWPADFFGARWHGEMGHCRGFRSLNNSEVAGMEMIRVINEDRMVKGLMNPEQ